MQTEQKPRQEATPDHALGEVVVPQSGLGGELGLSITEIAVMWMLHNAIAPKHLQRSLIQDIVDFYPVALDAIQQADTMRGARQSDLRLIYFKGLIVARTHLNLEMIDAIRHADSILERSAGRRDHPREIGHLSTGGLTEESDTLDHIAVALGHPARASH